MAYGLLVKSGNGATQIDSSDNTHIVYQKSSSGTSNAVSGAGSNDYRHVQVSVTMNPAEDLVFIRPTSTGNTPSAYVITYHSLNASGNVTTSGFNIYSDTNTTFYWYIFKKVSSLSAPTGYGLVAYNSSNQVTFSSEQLVARIKGRITGTGSITSSGNKLYALGCFQYTTITARLSPHRGKINGWVHTWNSDRSSISQSSSEVSPYGPQASGELTLDSAFYHNNGKQTALVIAAPDP